MDKEMTKAIKKLEYDLKKAREAVAVAMDQLTFVYSDVAEVEHLLKLNCENEDEEGSEESCL